MLRLYLTDRKIRSKHHGKVPSKFLFQFNRLMTEMIRIFITNLFCFGRGWSGINVSATTSVERLQTRREKDCKQQNYENAVLNYHVESILVIVIAM